jgi:hypothetical protein
MKPSATPYPTPAANQVGQQLLDFGEAFDGFLVVLDQLLVALGFDSHPLDGRDVLWVSHLATGSKVTVMRLELTPTGRSFCFSPRPDTI